MFAKEVADADLDREAGDLELLIGTDPAELHPTPVETTENLVFRKTRFRTGWTLYEYNDKLISSEGDSVDKSKANFVNTKYIQFLAQISFDSVGIDIPKKCSNCDACKELKLSGVLCREKEVKRSIGEWN